MQKPGAIAAGLFHCSTSMAYFLRFFCLHINNLTSHFYQLSVVIQETSFILISFGVHTDKTSHIFIEYSEIRLAIELLYSGNYLIAFEPISF